MENFNFGKRMKHARLSRELSLDELAQMTGLAAGTLKTFERRGVRPSLPTVKLIAGALNVNPKSLAGVSYDE